MKYAGFRSGIILGLLFLATMLSACQEKQAEEKTMTPAEQQAAPAAPAENSPVIPAANQGAPVPKDQALEVLRFGPSGEIKTLSQLVVMFNQPMVPLGDYQNAPDGVLTIDPPVEGRLQWLNQYTLAFIPEKPLTGSLELTARLDPAGLTALSGATTSDASEISIKLPDLNVSNSYQNDDVYDEDQALKPRWRVFFNQPPAEDSLREKAFFIYELPDESEGRIPAEIEKGSDGFEVFLFKPKERLPKNAAYRLVLLEGARSEAGPKPAGELTLAESRTYGPLTVKIDGLDDKPLSPEYGLYLSFSNPVDLREMVRLLSIDNGYDLEPLRRYYAKEPQEEAQESPRDEEESVDHIGSYLYIDGNFKAGTNYALTIDASAKDIFGQPLEQGNVLRFKTGQYRPRLDLGDGYGLIETSSDTRFKLLASNIKEAKIQAYALSADEAVKFLAAADFSPDYYRKDLEKADQTLAGLKPVEITLPIPEGARNGRTRVPLDLKKTFGDKLQGRLLYLKSFWNDNSDASGRPRRTFALVQVSDIGLAIKAGPASSLIWTTDLNAGRSWAGVELEVRSPEGELLWQGRSDENGLATLPGTIELMEKMEKAAGRQPGIFVVAKSGDQMSLWNANWNEGLENWRWNVNYAHALDGGGERHLLLSALPLYKPGEKAKIKIISRDGRGDRLDDFAGKKIHLEITDGMERVAAKALVEVSPFGTASYEFDIPANAALGQWLVKAGGEADQLAYAGSFSVMTYRPPAFDIKFAGFPKEALAGEDVSIEAKADYHFGAPVSNQPARYNVVSSPGWFRLPGNFSSYSVTNSYYPADEDEDSGFGYTEPSVTVASDEIKLDGDGRLKFPISLKPGPGQKPAPRRYSVYLTVTDVDQRQVGANNSILVHPADIYAGLTSDSFVGESGKKFPLKVIAADREGRLLPDRPIKTTVYRRIWQNVRRKSAGTAYEYVSRMLDEKIEERRLVSGKSPVEMEFVPEKPGYYIVQAEIEDEGGRINLASHSFYISGRGPVGWQMSNDDKLTLIADKNSYNPGETARIMIQSPFDQGQGLLTVERSGIRLSRVFTIDSQTPIVEVPIGEDDSPNVFVSVLLSRGRISDSLNEAGVDFGKPAIRAGYTELKIPGRKNLLSVEVKAGKEEVRPGEEVEVEVSVTDAEGRAMAEAEVALIAADAAVIQLASEDGYYPDQVWHRDQPLRIQTADNLVSLIDRQNWGLKGGNPGGGGAPKAARAAADGGMDLRRDFAALAFFEPHLVLDAEGKARIKIKMPENLSTFKIYAVATGHGALSGTGKSSVLVTRDLLARSALPGYAGVGDEFQAAMVVSNRGKKSGRARVSLQGENFSLLDEAAEKDVAVGPGESREVAFKVKAGKAEQAKFQFIVSMGDDRDGAEFSIPLSPANQLGTQASYERIVPGELRTDLALPPGADLDRGGLELELSPSLAGVLSEPFDWLLAYPHGCVEQSISKAYGSLTWLALKERFQGGAEREAQARSNIEDTLRRLNRWNQGGGFNTWPDNYDWSRRSVYLSAYALDFILSAREAGFESADPSLIKSICGFLKQALNSDYNSWPAWYSEAAIKQSRSYALAMLSRAGENTAAYISVMYQEKDKLGLYELINLGRAVHYQRQAGQSAQTGQLNSLIKLMEKHLLVTAGEVQFADNSPSTPEIWSSPTRNTALMLGFLCEAKPGHDLLPSLVRWLARETKEGHFGTTHNNALAVAALAKYVLAMEPTAPDLSLSVLLGDASFAEARFTSFTDPAVQASAPLRSIPEQDPAVVYTLEGRGQAWAALKLRSAPAEPDLSADGSGGFMLSRSFTVIDAEGKGRPGSEKFKRGDLVRVTVTVMAPARRHDVVLEDRVPAGFEPINFKLQDADFSLTGLVNEDGGALYWFNHQEIWPDRVAVYADYLDSGVYSFSYLARAITPGTYLTPGPRAEEMYAPETFGRGEGQRLTVE